MPRIRSTETAVKTIILPAGVLYPDHPSYAPSGPLTRHFYNRYGYWNYRGGRLVCFLHGHRFKWTKSTFYSDGCSPWGMQCTRCRVSVAQPHPHDGSSCDDWSARVLNEMAPFERASAMAGEDR